MTRTVEAWCCGVAADHELGNTKATVYASEEDVLKNCPCTTAEPNMCAPRKLTISFETNLVTVEVPMGTRRSHGRNN